MRLHLSKKFVAAFAVVAIGLGAGVGFAVWTSDGTGFGQAKALTIQNVTVTAATGAADLYPGFTQGKVFFTITNPNSYPMTFSAMTPGTVTSSNEAACPASNVTVIPATGLTLSGPAASTSATQSIANVVTMAAAAPNGCQGVTFTIGLTLTGTQV